MKRLDEIEARANAATEGPWYHRGDQDEVPQVMGPLKEVGHLLTQSWIAYKVCERPDAEFIAHAREDVPALVAALRGVLELHAETPYGCAVCEEQNWALPWPCPTVAAIRQHLGEDT